jgi:hypothetical protein
MLGLVCKPKFFNHVNYGQSARYFPSRVDTYLNWSVSVLFCVIHVIHRWRIDCLQSDTYHSCQSCLPVSNLLCHVYYAFLSAFLYTATCLPSKITNFVHHLLKLIYNLIFGAPMLYIWLLIW